MKEVQEQVRAAAMRRFESFAEEGNPDLPLFKQVGMQMVLFGVWEPKLYQLLFMQENRSAVRFDDVFGELDPTAETCLKGLREEYGLTEPEARLLFEHVWIYTFGVGSLCATGVCRFSEQTLGEMLTTEFRAMMLLVKNQWEEPTMKSESSELAPLSRPQWAPDPAARQAPQKAAGPLDACRKKSSPPEPTPNRKSTTCWIGKPFSTIPPPFAASSTTSAFSTAPQTAAATGRKSPSPRSKNFSRKTSDPVFPKEPPFSARARGARPFRPHAPIKKRPGAAMPRRGFLIFQNDSFLSAFSLCPGENRTDRAQRRAFRLFERHRLLFGFLFFLLLLVIDPEPPADIADRHRSRHGKSAPKELFHINPSLIDSTSRIAHFPP